jgi:hypothetical protein
MYYFISRLPDEVVCYIKDYVLSVDIRLQMLYQKYNIDEQFIKKRLMVFNSKQLEQINWRYLYYKIFTVSPPRCDNNNLTPIFNHVPTEYYFKEGDDIYYCCPKYKLSCNSIKKYYLISAITRSDFYSNKVRTEMGRKRQQNCNIINGWYYLKNGNRTSKIPEFDMYMCNVEYELLRSIMILYPYIKSKKNSLIKNYKNY